MNSGVWLGKLLHQHSEILGGKIPKKNGKRKWKKKEKRKWKKEMQKRNEKRKWEKKMQKESWSGEN